jgi:hypothetical protein
MIGVSTLYLLFGGNQVSGRNIELVVTGPNAVAGGDILEFSVDITNNNAVALEGGTLIINYPTGTRSVEETPRDIFEERLPLEPIAPGETRTVPLKAAVFGEENQAKEVGVSMDYRVAGSGGTFFKEAEPLAFSINTSPVVVRITGFEKISPGQEFDLTLTVQSNAEAPLADLLVSAEYPEQFRFISATPAPSFRDSAWVLDEVAAKGSQEIKIRGVASGLSSESFVLRFLAGTPRTDNPFIVGAILAQTTHTLTVEQPFVGVDVSVNGDDDGEAVVASGDQTEIIISVTNNQSEPLYDMNLQLGLSGNAFSANQVRGGNGFFDSVNNRIRYEVSGIPELAIVRPGERRDFRAQIAPGSDATTATLSLTANVYARRVSERNVPEELIGVGEATVRYASVASLARQADHSSGPIPPQANAETRYRITLEAQAGANDLTGAQVIATLPPHVEWRDSATGPGTASFNPTTKEVRWSAGDIKGGTSVQLSFLVSMTPSVTQIGQIPVLVNRQSLTATDRFTGTPVTADAVPLTAELSAEAGFGRDNGLVLPQ